MNRYLIALPALLALTARTGLAQCSPAMFTYYDGIPPNPVRLITSYPGPVIGGSQLVDAQGAELTSFGALLVSARPSNTPLGGLIDGILLVDPRRVLARLPYVRTPSWRLFFPDGTAPGISAFLQSFHSKASGGWELSSGLELTTGYALWDLAFEIEGAPTSATACSCIDWRVRVTNRGNLPSPNVCAFTGINCSPGPGDYRCNLGLFNFTTPSIAPGDSWVYDLNGSGCYFVSCNAFRGTQYIKAEINYTAGCYDLCNENDNNFAERPITIR